MAKLTELLYSVDDDVVNMDDLYAALPNIKYIAKRLAAKDRGISESKVTFDVVKNYLKYDHDYDAIDISRIVNRFGSNVRTGWVNPHRHYS